MLVGPGPDSLATLDLPTIRRFAEVALEALAAAREEIDALNVYPVPDGDTGTNMFLTFESARHGLVDAEPPDDLRAALAGFARGALLGARGNSGVIFSQIVGAHCKHMSEAGPDDRAAVVLTRVAACDAPWLARCAAAVTSWLDAWISCAVAVRVCTYWVT